MYRTQTTASSSSGRPAVPVRSDSWDEEGAGEEWDASWVKSYVGGHKHRQNLADVLHLGHHLGHGPVGPATALLG